MREGDLGLVDVGVPTLLPLEAVVALVPVARQNSDRLLDRYFSRAGEHVMAVIFALPWNRHGVLQVSVPDILSQMRKSVGRLFSFDAGMMRVPEESDI